MAALQCEICGGKLIGKPGGVFECDSCGMEYSTEWAKQKIQEIKGTVKVEGTVEVQGTVQVEGAANKDSLLRRGFMALEDTKWNDADESFDKVLDIDPECAEAYLGKLMAELHVSKQDGLKKCRRPLDSSPNYQRVLHFGNSTLADEIKALNESCILWIKARQTMSNSVATGLGKTVGLKSDGTAVAVGCDVSDWQGVIAVAAGLNLVVGLKSDGTVVTIDDSDNNRCKVLGWRNIVAIAIRDSYTVGLKSDGTVKYSGGISCTDDWYDIVAISAGSYHIVGLKSDGTVVADGYNSRGQCNVTNWSDIIAITAGSEHTVGVKSDGSVVATGLNADGQCNVSNWENIVAVAAGDSHTVGLKADGTVIAVGANRDGGCDVDSWTDILSISAGNDNTLGLKSNGSLVAVGSIWGQDKVRKWKLFNSLDMLEEERTNVIRMGKERRIEEEEAARERMIKDAKERYLAKIDNLNGEKASLSTELANLKGMFSGKRRKEIEARLAAIDAELAKLK